MDEVKSEKLWDIFENVENHSAQIENLKSASANHSAKIQNLEYASANHSAVLTNFSAVVDLSAIKVCT